MTTPTLTKKAQAEADKADAIVRLRKMFPKGSTVPVIMRHVASSGMSRSISVLRGGDVVDVTWLVARATGGKIDARHGGIKMGGCGMDMGFALVYDLARTLYPEWRCNGIRQGRHRCMSNDHFNERGDDYVAGFRKGRKHSDSGYALHHRWL